MASVSLENVRKSYDGKTEIVKGISLEIEDGEFVTLVGPSGCGKSTTLNLIAGLEAPSSGVLRIGGDVVNDRSPRERDIAMVFQSYALYPHMTVEQNIAFPLKFAQLERDEIARRVHETAARLEIEPLLARRPKELSGGQRQRVALARALVRRPKVFLFDEPLSNLDAALRVQMRSEIKKLHEDLGATFIYVTHDQTEAMTLSDRIAVMHHGVLQQVAPPAEIYRQPANVFVASFFGAPKINLLKPATLRLENVPAHGASNVLVGLRPEDVEVQFEEVTDARAGLEGKVYLVEPTGAETWVTVQLGAERVTARAPAMLLARSGDRAWVHFDPRSATQFDADSGQRLAAAAEPTL